MNPRMRRWVALVAVVVACGCGPGIKNLVWPPASNPTVDGLYPYDFERRGLAGVKALHHKMLGARFQDKKDEQVQLYALGRAQIDAFLYAMTLDPDEKAEFLINLGEMLGKAGADEETFMADPGLLLEPFDVLGLKYPKSVYATASEDGRIAFRLLTHERLGDEEMERLAGLAAGQGSMSPFVRGVMLVVASQALGEVAHMNAGDRSVTLVMRLERFAGKAEQEGEWAELLERVLGWTATTVHAARNDPDPLFIDLRPRTEEARALLEALPFPAGLPDSVELPERVKVEDEVGDPFRYIVLDGSGEIRVATSIVYVVDSEGGIGRMDEKNPYSWPGKVVGDITSLPAALARATEAVSALGPSGGSPLWDRAAPLVVAPAVSVTSFLPILDVLRSAMDHVVIGVRAGSRARYVAADIRPNCAMAGTRIGAVLGPASVIMDNVTVGEEDQVVLEAMLDEPPMLLATQVEERVGHIVGRPRPDVFIEVAHSGGQWTWWQLVAVEEGLHAAVAEAAMQEDVDAQVQTFLLPGMTMTESRKVEIAAEKSSLSELPDPTQVGREELVLVGTYGDYDSEVQDAWLSAYLEPLTLDRAATVVLDVARCWGGDYRERAVEALSRGKRSILEQVASYLGDPVMGDVAQTILGDAGSRAVDVLVHKIKSRDEPVWTGAWTVLASMDPADIGSGLVVLLGDPDPELRIRALKLYSNSMPAGDHPELLPLLEDPDIYVRRWAISTVGMLGVKDAAPRLLEYVAAKATQPPVLAEALFALGLLEVEESVPYMLSGAGHPSVEVRESVALALGNVGVEGVMHTLLGLLGDDEPTVVLNAIKSVGMLESEEAVPYLESLATSPHAAVGEAAWLAIQRIQAANTVSLAEMDGASVKETCTDLGAEHLSALAKNPSKEALKCLLSKLKSKNPGVREAACVALGERGDTSAMSALKKRTKDKKSGVRQAAWKALEILDKIKKKKKKKKKKKSK